MPNKKMSGKIARPMYLNKLGVIKMEHSMFSIIPIFIIILAIAILLYKFITHSQFKNKVEENSYIQYKNENPHLVSEGKVICKICGSSEIGIMPMHSPAKNPDVIANPEVIAHICNHCGTTLYYSKVGK